MTKQGETDNYSASDFINTVEKYLDKKVDHIISNNSKISKKVLLSYSLESKVELGKFVKKSDKRVSFAPLAMTNKRGALVSDPNVIKKCIRNIIE